MNSLINRSIKLQTAILFFIFISVSLIASKVSASEMSLNLNKMPISEVFTLYSTECTKNGFAISPEVNTALETLPLNIVIHVQNVQCSTLRNVLDSFFSRSQIRVKEVSGVTTLVLDKTLVPDEKSGFEMFVYTPKYKSLSMLIEMASFAVQHGQFANNQASTVSANSSLSITAATSVPAQPGNGASMLSTQEQTQIVFYGPKKEVDMINALFEKIDIPIKSVNVQVGVYEYFDSNEKNSAFKVLGEILEGSFKMASDVGQLIQGNYISLGSTTIQAIFSSLDEDERFTQISKPQLMVKDGSSANFFTGEDLRVNGTIVLDNNGNPIVSKETLTAGIRLEVTPKIRSNAVELDLFQSVSSFRQQKVSDSDPAILKRDLKTSFMAVPGEVYIIAGLDNLRDGSGKSRYFGLTLAKSKEQAKSQIFVLLSVYPQ